MTHLLRDTLSAVAAKLPSDRFLRLNRSTLVNIAQIKELQPAVQGGYDVLLRDGTQLPQQLRLSCLDQRLAVEPAGNHVVVAAGRVLAYSARPRT